MTRAAAVPTPRCDFARESDRALMARIAGADAGAFEEIYLRHHRNALAQARKLCTSRELAEDVAQEAFLSLWRGAHHYRPGLGSVGVWLSSLVRNRAIDAWRRAAARPIEVAAAEHDRVHVHGAHATQPYAPERAVALSLIADLPAAQKEAVFLSFFGDMTHSEIATRADAPLGTIKGRVRLGLEKLRYGYEDEPPSRRAQPGPLRTTLRAFSSLVTDPEPILPRGAEPALDKMTQRSAA